MSPEYGSEREPEQDLQTGSEFDRIQLNSWKLASDINLLSATCPVIPGRVAIPTQFPALSDPGRTNETDCTTYPESSKQVDTYNDMLDSVVRITGTREREDGKVSSAFGSGFFVTPDGKIATDFHNVKETSNIKVYAADGSELKARVIGVDRRADLAILQVEQPQDILKRKFFSSLTLGSSANLERGSEVSAWGYPLGLSRLYMSPGGFPAVPGGFQERMSLKEALIRSARQVEHSKPIHERSTINVPSLFMKGENGDRIVFESRIMANYGNSGGPITDSHDQVVGIVGLSNRGNSTMATPVEDLTRLLAFVSEQQRSNNPRLFFDEFDVSPSQDLSESDRRLVERGRRLESQINFESIRLPSQNMSRNPVSLEQFLVR